MNAGNEKAEQVFAEAREIADPAARHAYLSQAFGSDAALRQEVESLLGADEQGGEFMRTEAIMPTLPLQTEKCGDRIGRYKLLEQIGEGGFGVVWMAEQEEPMRRRVALKIIKLGMDTQQVLARFEAERQALAMMEHPNIAKVFDGGATDTGRPYFVMELVKGVPITAYCDANKLSTPERLELFMQVCQAVQHAHQKGVIHRDLKPSNILVTVQDDRPVPKVIDFGVAKATQARLTEKTVFTRFHQLIGTPAYMSPEQAGLGSLDVDTRSDVYSLGVLVYELLTGCTPFDTQKVLAAGYEAVMRTIREEEPPKPSTRLSTLQAKDLNEVAANRRAEPAKLNRLVRGDLDWIVLKALEKDRARRYETANELASDIAHHLHNEPVTAAAPSGFYKLQKFARRNKATLVTVSAIVVLLVAGVAVSVWQAVRATRAERDQARLRADADKARQNEAGLRQDAETSKELALTEAGRAQAAAVEANSTLSASDFLQGVRFIADHNGNDALAFLARSLVANPTNDAALTRLTTLLTYHSWMTPTLILKPDVPMVLAQFSPDGKRIVTASQDKTVRVWDAQTGQPLMEPLKHDSNVTSVLFSPDGERLLTVSQGTTVRVWDAQTGQPLMEPLKHDVSVTSVQFSPDGTRIVTAWKDTARVWDAHTGQPLTEPLKHGGPVVSAQFSPDGKRIVTASWDRTARVWDAQTSQPVTEPLKHDGPVHSAQFSPDGKRVVTASSAAWVWDAQTGQPLTEPMKHGGAVNSAQFSPNGKQIVTASQDATARVWDAQTGLPLSAPMKHGYWVNTAQFSFDGKRIVTASNDKTACVWDAETGRQLTEPMKHASGVNSAQFSRDGKQIVTVSQDNTVHTWDARSSQPLGEPLKHKGVVYCAQFSPDGRRVVTATWTNTALVWDAQSGQPLTEPMIHGGMVVVSAQFSPNGRQIVTASDDATARVWDAQTGQPLTEPLTHGGTVVSAEFSPDGKRIVTASYDKTARVWDAQTGQPLIQPMTHGDTVSSAQFSPDGKRVVTASWDSSARVWNAQTGQPLTERLTHAGKVYSARFSPDGKRIVTASWDKTARVWDARTGQPLIEFMTDGGQVWSAQFSPDGKRIATASQDNTARVWDAQTGQPLTEPMKHDDFVASARFSPDGKRIVTASWDNTARVWDAQTGQPLTEPMKHGGWVNSAQFSPDGKRVVTASQDTTARVWDVAPTSTRFPDWLLLLSEAISGQVLNKKGILEPTRLNRAEVLNQIRQKLSREPDDDDWVVWGRWYLADRATRTICPFSKLTVPKYIENRIEEMTPQSLDEAEELAVGNPALSQRISQARRALKVTK
jgi:WD40 repeat protein/serine/threonine protein kinase